MESTNNMNEQRPLACAPNRSVRRQSLPQEIFFEGWIECSLTRKANEVKQAFLLLNRVAFRVFQNDAVSEQPPVVNIVVSFEI